MECQVSSALFPDEVFDGTQIHVWVKYLQQAHVNNSQPQDPPNNNLGWDPLNGSNKVHICTQ